MKSITLAGANITSPQLAFGCNALLGPRTRQEAIGLLEAAFEAGIRHFDVARYYGFGDAEGVVGEFMRSRPNQMTVTTKFGINPGKAVNMRFAVNIARKLMRMAPALRKLIGGQAKHLVKGGSFSVPEARASLETSLRELKTEHIHIFLLHDGTLADCRSPGLREFMDNAVKEGKIGCYGMGTSIESVLAVSEAEPIFARVVQFESSVLRPGVMQIPDRVGRTVITHGCLSASFTKLRQYLAARPEVAARFSREVGADCSDPAVLSALMLNHAISLNPAGLVLFSSTRPDNIRRNVRSVSECAYSDEQLNRFFALVRGLKLTDEPR